MGAGERQKIVLAGRAFVPVGVSTFRHDLEFLRLLRVAGLEDPSMRTGETPEAFAWRVMHALVDTHTLLPMLACLIVPEHLVREPARGWRGFVEQLVGVEREKRASGWTPEVQAETAAFLGELDEPADKERVYALVMELVFPFLQAGLASWTASPRSSGHVDEPIGLAADSLTAAATSGSGGS